MTPELSRTLKKIALVSAGSFVFAFSMVPLYNAACEKVFGIKLEPGAAGAAQLAGQKPDDKRVVRVQFDGTVNSKLAWDFKPTKSWIDVHPGRQYEMTYVARNRAAEGIVGHAAYSLAPNQASGYFAKTECFCFTEQALAAGEQRLMPVRFIVNPSLPDDVGTITLSYTFYRDDDATAKLDAVPVAGAARAAP